MLLGTSDRAGHQIIVPTKGLGSTVDNKIRPQLERVLMMRRGEGIIDYNQGADRIGRLANGNQINDLA